MDYYFSTTHGFQTKEIHGNNIPLSAVKLSQVEYDHLINGQAAGRLIVIDQATGRPTLGSEATLSLEETRQRKLSALNVMFDEKVYALQVGISPFEVKSWPDQKIEAAAYVANTAASVPTLTAIAAERGMDVKTLAQKVMQKANAYAIDFGRLVGKRQALEKLILAAKSVKELSLIKWDKEDITAAKKSRSTLGFDAPVSLMETLLINGQIPADK